MTWRTFFDAVNGEGEASLASPARGTACRGVNAMGRVVRGAAVARA
jgi:hypothetical protein